MFEEFKESRINERFSREDISIRDACVDDILEIAKMNCDHDQSNDLNKYIEKYKKEFKEGKSLIYVAEYDSNVVGYGRTIFLEDIEYPFDSVSGWYLMGLVVKKDYRLKGIGEMLTKFRMNKIEEKKQPIYCVTNATNKVSIDLHQKLGFQIIDEKPGFFTIKFSDGLGYLLRYIPSNIK